MHDETIVIALRCGQCGALDPGPRDACSQCFARALAPIDLPGAGTLVTWTMIRRPPAAFRADGPYAVAVVMLDAGLQVTGRLAGANVDIKPGTRVRAAGRTRDAVLFEVDA